MDVSCLAVLWSLMMTAKMIRMIWMMMEKVNVNLEPSLHIDVAHLVPTEEGIVFKNHLKKHSSTKMTTEILKRVKKDNVKRRTTVWSKHTLGPHVKLWYNFETSYSCGFNVERNVRQDKTGKDMLC